METLYKMILVFAWIGVIVCPLIIAIKIWLQRNYYGSLEEKIHNLNGFKTVYTNGIPTVLLVAIVCLVYLIVR